jgi:GNAT superfamily N-acetyltransferase
MKEITYTDFESGDISFLADLCNALMSFQAKKAKIKPEVMSAMNFENRLIPDFQAAKRKYITVAWDQEKAVGFAFASVSDIDEKSLEEKPVWANDLHGTGFYPENYEVPQKIGTYKLLYVLPEYRGLHIGGTLSEKIMTWLKSHNDVEDLWVFVANGNESVGTFYEKIGFTFSHSVFDGFIQAYTEKPR